MRDFAKVERSGKRIVIPESMTLKEARIALKKIEDDEETIIEISETFNAYPTEGAYALRNALDSVFGFFRQVSGANPPKMVHIPISATERSEVPWGRIEIPGIEGFIETGYDISAGRIVFRLTGKVLKKYRDRVQELMTEIQRQITTNSIYRGKAINVSFPDLNDENVRTTFNPIEDVPKFMDVRGIDEADLILPKDVEDQVKTGLFAPIKYLEAIRRANVPFKRGICLEGTYGVGKSLTARVTAAICERFGVTFLHLKEASDLARAIQFAREYEPAVVFAEDVDRVVNGEDRTEAVNMVLNTIDGIESKTRETMVVFTTNHVENINSAMLRAGRLDMVIHMAKPDSWAVDRLLRRFAGTMLEDGVTLHMVSKTLEGQIPADIREVVERAKLAAISREEGKQRELKLNEEDLLIAAGGLIAQRDALKRHEPTREDGLRVMGEALAKGIRTGFESAASNEVMSYERE